MDMTQSIEPRSDQVNADDLIGGPITYTVREVVAGKAEHPFDFLLVETDRAYRPSKTMRRVIVAAWGSEASNYAGRRLTLYREPSIMFGGQKVGGIRISHMSHIAGPVEVMAQTTRGKREKFTVRPLPDKADDTPFVPTAAPAPREAESPDDSRPVAAEPADAPGANVGGLQIASQDDAMRVIRAMTDPQKKKLKALLGIEGTTTNAALAAELYDQRATHFAADVRTELEEMDA